MAQKKVFEEIEGPLRELVDECGRQRQVFVDKGVLDVAALEKAIAKPIRAMNASLYPPDSWGPFPVGLRTAPFSGPFNHVLNTAQLAIPAYTRASPDPEAVEERLRLAVERGVAFFDEWGHLGQCPSPPGRG